LKYFQKLKLRVKKNTFLLAQYFRAKKMGIKPFFKLKIQV